MAQPIAFDTHAYVKKLKSVGFSEEQAETLATAQAELIDERLATKHDVKLLQRDIKKLEIELKRDMDVMKTELKRDMKEMEIELKRDTKEMELRLRHDLTVRLGGMMALSITVVAALVKVL